MNLLVVTGKYPAVSHTFVIQEIAESIKRGFNVTVIASNKGDNDGDVLAKKLGLGKQNVIYASIKDSSIFKPNLSRFSSEIRSISLFKYYGFILNEKRKTFFSDLLKFERVRNSHHIHAHFVEWAYHVALPLSKILKIPFTLTVHDSFLEEHPDWLLKELQKNAKKIILVSSEWKKKWINKTGYDEGLVVVHNGINVQEFKRKRHKKSDKIKIICISRLVPHKRIMDVIIAAKDISQYNWDFTIDIIGDGPEKKKLEKVISDYDLSKIVYLHGSLPHPKIIEKLSEADIFVHCSEKESFGIVIIEAMASQLPVIAANSGGIRDIINHEGNGLIYPAGNVEVLTKELLELLRNQQKREILAISGYKTVMQKFTIEKHMEKMISAWTE